MSGIKIKLEWVNSSQHPTTISYVESPISPERDKPLLRVEYMFLNEKAPYYSIDIMGFRTRAVIADNMDQAKELAEKMLLEAVNFVYLFIKGEAV